MPCCWLPAGALLVAVQCGWAWVVRPSSERAAPHPSRLEQVFHPAIDTEGHVDMSLLDDEWRPEM